MPLIRPFRALRFRREAVPDLSLVVSPPYDVVSPEQQQALLDRDARNVVRLDLPESAEGEAPEERYRRAARTLAAWRSNGTLQKDQRPSVYAYEQVYRVPGRDREHVQRGFFGRLRLEPLSPGSGVRPHERTMEGPREDRYQLLRATGVNTSPVVVLYEDSSGDVALVLGDIARTPPEAEVRDDDGVCHRVWVLPDDGEADGPVARLTRAAGAGPLTIADGHHRYETALRYRDERRMSRSCEEDPPFDYLLALLLEAGSQPLTVLATHRVIRDLGDGGAGLLTAAAELFDVGPAGRDELVGWGSREGGRGRFGVWTRSGGAVLTARRDAFEPLLPAGGDALRALDVTLLGAALERLAAIGSGALVAGQRVAYTKSAEEAIGWVDARRAASDAAFLLQGTPVASILEVAAQGEVMPQKSTYFYPKPLTGLVINALEP